jgi:succinate dehydrogenase / fumarate reductase, cytochrome b subunit
MSTCAIRSFYNSTIGKKMVMAITGLVLVGFIVGHMIGNLKIFIPCKVGEACKLDLYAQFIREIGEHLAGKETVLWGVRAVLVLALILHVDSAIKLTLRNRKASGTKYAVKKHQSSTYASRSMALGGSLIFVFVIVHILHFTTGHLHFAGFEHMKVQANVTRAFQSVGWVAGYCIAVFALSFHLYHGVWSMFQTLGADSPALNSMLRRTAAVLAVVVGIGFAVVPLSVYTGIIPVPVQ